MNNIAGYWVRETKAKGFDLTKMVDAIMKQMIASGSRIQMER